MLVNLRALLGAIVDILLFRRGPENLPASAGLLVGLIVTNCAVAALMVWLFSLGELSILEMVVGVLLPLIWYWVALNLARKPERFVQTMSAFFGVNTVLVPIVVPLLASLAPFLVKPDPDVPPPAVPALLFFATIVWGLVVWVRIVRAAFEWPLFAAIVLIVAQAYVSHLVDLTFFTTPPAPV